MNDRYLYRAKRTDNGEWVEGFLVKKHGLFFIYDIINSDTCRQSNYEVDPSTICQCTGKRDVYGKLIFEHEIVRECYSEYTGEVKFGEYEKGYGWYIEWISERAQFYRTDFLYWQKEVSLEVIGNIFDNPELLEVGE